VKKEEARRTAVVEEERKERDRSGCSVVKEEWR
jgi:hypothetical protein